MKKLFLASSFWFVAEHFKQRFPGSNKFTVAFVPTAADVYDDKWFVEKDRDALKSLGLKILELPLKLHNKASCENILQKADVIFVGGGNTFYLLQEARKSGFVDLVPKMVEKGKIYVGSSAGSYLACPTIEVASWKHQDRNTVGLTDLTALNLVPFLLSAHYDEQYDNSLREGIASTNYPVKLLTDEQAMSVIDDSYELVGKGEEIKL